MNRCCAKLFVLAVTTLLALAVTTASANPVLQALLEEYQLIGAGPFSSKAGQMLWSHEVNGRSCTSCHSASARAGGKHNRTGKTIKPMAPSAYAQRMTDRKKTEKWFLRNCRWTFSRECTPQEKGDLLSWLNQQ